MLCIKFIRFLTLVLATTFILGCQPPNMSQLKKFPPSIANIAKKSGSERRPAAVFSKNNPKLLGEILNGSLAGENAGSDFSSSVKYALDNDPSIISRQLDVQAKKAAVKINSAQKDFQVGTTIYGGIEDITDNTKGIALALNASRLIFDGGKLDSEIEAAQFSVDASEMYLAAVLDQRSLELCEIWLELEKYKSLQAQIDKRLAVLNPLIDQLEEVAKAGIGDVSKVTSAQRTVASIRVEQTKITEGLAQAKLEFLNEIGSLSGDIGFDYDHIANLVPEKIDDSLIQRSPMLLFEYANYRSSVSRLEALQAKDKFDVDFRAKAQRPFAGSGYDSDESFGLVGTKTIFNGQMLESELKEAKARVQEAAAKIEATYRAGARTVNTARQNIDSMDRAILLGKDNAKLTADEILYLRQQLIIGGSTLESVLLAEARLYDAESKEIIFKTEKHRSELVIASALGLLSGSFGFKGVQR